MAEPLSAFDVARTRFGFGTSGDPAERRRFAEAGLSPLTSEERMRMERGWGASPLASKESREAMVAEEVRRGDRPAYQLPEAYGGRPEGTTRRAIRMQKAWDAEQAARIQQEEAIRQQDEYNRKVEFDTLRYQSEAYDLRTKQNEDLFAAKEDADQRAAEAAFTEFRNGLDPNDPLSVGLLARYIARDSRLAESPVAKNSYEYFAKAAENSSASIANQQQEALSDARSEARRAGVSEEAIDKIIIGARERDDEGNEFININKALAGVTKLTDTVIGKRALSEEERKEGRGDYRPMSVAEAQDRLDVATAEFEALQAAGIDEEDEDYQKAEAKLRRAEAQLTVSQKREGGVAAPQKSQYTPEQISEAKRVARNPNHSRNKQAIRFLNSIGESY